MQTGWFICEEPALICKLNCFWQPIIIILYPTPIFMLPSFATKTDIIKYLQQHCILNWTFHSPWHLNVSSTISDLYLFFTGNKLLVMILLLPFAPSLSQPCFSLLAPLSFLWHCTISHFGILSLLCPFFLLLCLVNGPLASLSSSDRRSLTWNNFSLHSCCTEYLHHFLFFFRYLVYQQGFPKYSSSDRTVLLL